MFHLKKYILMWNNWNKNTGPEALHVCLHLPKWSVGSFYINSDIVVCPHWISTRNEIWDDADIQPTKKCETMNAFVVEGRSLR